MWNELGKFIGGIGLGWLIIKIFEVIEPDFAAMNRADADRWDGVEVAPKLIEPGRDARGRFVRVKKPSLTRHR